jgi:hypothetical protein
VIPKAHMSLHRSKRRAALADQDSGERAEKLKAARNLDSLCTNGNESSPKPSFLQLSNDVIISNMSDIEITVGKDITTDSLLIESLKKLRKRDG